jgi:hypothetical protein
MLRRLLPLWLLVCALCPLLPAQTGQFDVFRYQRPPGYADQKVTGYLFLQKKAGLDFSQLFLYPVSPGTGDAQADFDKAWDFVARKPAENISDPESRRTETVEGWTVHSGSAEGAYNGQPYQLILTSFTRGPIQFFAAFVFTEPSELQAVESFLGSVQPDAARLEERVRALAARVAEPSPATPASAAAGPAPAPKDPSVPAAPAGPTHAGTPGRATAMRITYPKMTYKDGSTVQAFFDYLQVVRPGGEEGRMYFPNPELDNAGDRPGRRNHESRYWDAYIAPEFDYAEIVERYRDSTGWAATIYEAEVTHRTTGRRSWLNLIETWENGRCTLFVALAPDRPTLHNRFKASDDFRSIGTANEFHAPPADLVGTWSSYDGAATSYYYAATGLYAGTATAQTSSEFTFRPDGTYESTHAATTTFNTSPRHVTSRYAGRYTAAPGSLTLTNRAPNDPGEFHSHFEAVRGGYALRLVNKKFTGNNTLLVKTK